MRSLFITLTPSKIVEFSNFSASLVNEEYKDIAYTCKDGVVTQLELEHEEVVNEDH
jgi:hypothetical protein